MRREVEVDVQWLELLIGVEAGGDFVLASLNCLYFLRYETGDSPSRKAGALCMVLVNSALAFEALLFLSQAPTASLSWTRATAVVAVRSTLLFAAGLLSALIVRKLLASR